MNESVNEYIYEVTAEQFNELVVEKSKTIPVLVDFWADWCEPCKMLMPILQSLAEKHHGKFCLAKVNTDNEQDLAIQLGIQSLPTVVLFKDMQPIENFMGVKPESEIEKLISPYFVEVEEVQPAPDNLHGLQELIEAGEYQQALELVATDDSDEAVFAKIEIYLMMSEVELAQKCMDQLSDEQKEHERVEKIAAKLKIHQIDSEENTKTCQDKLLSGQVEVAIEELLELLAKDSKNTNIKQMLIAGFCLMDDPKQTASYRRKMASLLF
ncbi:MAG: thioredoxin [Proteobacteria bacterium]|nr:thioredoxin [Pseudomonadota bacterium]